jgi:hypothetical protein
MMGADRSNRNFNVSNTDGNDLKFVNGEEEKSGANGSVDSGGVEVNEDKSKTISGGGNQSSGGENNFIGGFNITGAFRDGNDGFNKTGKRDGGVSDGEANGCLYEFFGGENNGQKGKLVAEGNSKGNKIYGVENHDGDSRGVLNRAFDAENHRDRDAEDSKRKDGFRDGRDRDGGDGQDRDRGGFCDGFRDGSRDGGSSDGFRDGFRDGESKDGFRDGGPKDGFRDGGSKDGSRDG